MNTWKNRCTRWPGARLLPSWMQKESMNDWTTLQPFLSILILYIDYVYAYKWYMYIHVICMLYIFPSGLQNLSKEQQAWSSMSSCVRSLHSTSQKSMPGDKHWSTVVILPMRCPTAWRFSSRCHPRWALHPPEIVSCWCVCALALDRLGFPSLPHWNSPYKSNSTAR